MEIKVKEEIVLKVELNKDQLEQDLKKSVDLERCIKNNLKIIKNDSDETDVEAVKEFIWLGTDWYDLIVNFSYYGYEKMTIKVFAVDVRGLTQYRPDTVRMSKGNVNSMNYEEFKDDFKDYLFVIEDPNDPAHVNKHIERMLATRIIDYVGTKWKVVWPDIKD